MNLINKVKDQFLKLAVLVTIVAPTLSMASTEGDGIIGVNDRLVKAADSFGALISIAAFIVGAASLFRAITTLMNHSENARENPMKNVLFYGIAAGVGLGYGFFTSTAMETVLGKSNSDIVSDDIFNANSTK